VLSSEQERPISHPIIGLETVFDNQKALGVGIKGYVHVRTVKDTPTTLIIEKGKSGNVSFEIELISYSPSFEKVNLNIDPKGQVGWTSGRCYGKGEPLILLNDYVQYDLNGEITVYKNHPIIVTMTISIPEDAPSFELPIKAVGIGVDYVSVFDSEVNLIVK